MGDIKDYTEYVYILDFRNNAICEIVVTGDDINLDSEALLDKYGFDIDNCNFMYSDYKLNLENVNKENE